MCVETNGKGEGQGEEVVFAKRDSTTIHSPACKWQCIVIISAQRLSLVFTVIPKRLLLIELVNKRMPGIYFPWPCGGFSRTGTAYVERNTHAEVELIVTAIYSYIQQHVMASLISIVMFHSIHIQSRFRRNMAVWD